MVRAHSRASAVLVPAQLDRSLSDDEHPSSMVTRTTRDGRRALWAELGEHGTIAPTPAQPARIVGGVHNVLMWFMFVLAVWLSVGALTAQLFGAFVSAGLHSWERDEDD